MGGSALRAPPTATTPFHLHHPPPDPAPNHAARPAANGQGRTREEALKSLAQAIDLLLEDLREEGLAAMPSGAERATVTVD